MKSLIIKTKKLIDSLGTDEAMNVIDEMLAHQPIKTFDHLEDAIEEELVLMEVQI